MVKRLMFALLVLGGCSTKANPNACCVSADDCSQAGLDTVTACDQGLTCVNNQCLQETCATDGCTAAMPVCSAVTNACEGCTDSSQCAPYDGTTVCDTSSGACVECASSSDCPTDEPVCDTGGCRACTVDTDCMSGACAEDGRCVDESSIVYLDAAGSDSGTCTRIAPCRSLAFGLAKATPSRSHLVLSAGTYMSDATLHINSTLTTAARLDIHGGGALVATRNGNDGGVLSIEDVSVRLHDLVFQGNLTAGPVVQTNGAPCELFRLKVTGDGSTHGLTIGGNTHVHDVEIANCSVGIGVGLNGHLTLDRAIIHGGYEGIDGGNQNGRVDITNTLIFDTSSYGMNLANAAGSVAFSTIADCGLSRTMAPIAVKCSSALGLTVSSTIVWTPQSSAVASIDSGCTLSTVIAGPLQVVGAMNVDPGFVDETHRDYHLSTGSPARDMLDNGPMADFEGDARPQGPKYDLGADEAR